MRSQLRCLVTSTHKCLAAASVQFACSIMGSFSFTQLQESAWSVARDSLSFSYGVGSQVLVW